MRHMLRTDIQHDRRRSTRHRFHSPLRRRVADTRGRRWARVHHRLLGTVVAFLDRLERGAVLRSVKSDLFRFVWRRVDPDFRSANGELEDVVVLFVLGETAGIVCYRFVVRLLGWVDCCGAGRGAGVCRENGACFFSDGAGGWSWCCVRRWFRRSRPTEEWG
ncbi:hypothetical protein BDV98DRAFT_574656 [Pterulicium gracile]|uniref:Uncharacterized protein n=1 Tax=Pterulicium gracile TaxID=1884261 RepID=A0A5C3Q8E4_9AGAR|nr:hypothetical protein BDV98DRAFT_574656 [Pterula gracilis]